jgi:hypothetical protein
MAVFQTGFEAGALGFQVGRGLAHRRDPQKWWVTAGSAVSGECHRRRGEGGEEKKEEKNQGKKRA